MLGPAVGASLRAFCDMALMSDGVQQSSHGLLVLGQSALPRGENEGPGTAWDVKALEEKPTQHRHGEFESRGLRAYLRSQCLETWECFTDVITATAAEAEQVDDASRRRFDCELPKPPRQAAGQQS